jgi:hypothetical protein
MGRHKIKILFHGKKKNLVEHLESGFVGNKQVGYKNVKKGDKDIVLVRHCYKNSHFEKTGYRIKPPYSYVCLLILFRFFGAFYSSIHLLIKNMEVII